MPFFSVIIPTYNKEHFLWRSISSVLEQTFDDFEIIVVNDGSTDNTLEILSNIADPRLRVITTSNKGVSSARNTAIENSNGKYLIFLDSDDSFLCDYLLKYNERLIECGFPDILIGGITAINNNGSIISISPQSNEVYDSLSFKRVFMETTLSNDGLFGYIAGKAVSRSIVTGNSITFDTSLKLAEDLDFWIQCYKRANCIAIFSYRGYQYYTSLPGSSVFADDVDYISQLYIWSRIYQYVQPVEEREVAFFDKKFTGYALSAFNELNDIRYRRVKQLLNEIRVHKAEAAYKLIHDGKPLPLLLSFGSAPLLFLYLKLRHYIHDKRNHSRF